MSGREQMQQCEAQKYSTPLVGTSKPRRRKSTDFWSAGYGVEPATAKTAKALGFTIHHASLIHQNPDTPLTMFLGFDRIGGSRSRRSNESGGQDMGSQDDFFEALGPTSPPPNDSPGFFTNASRIWRGVDVAGKQLGVRGRGGDPGSVGVEGHGGLGGNGVFGQGMNGVVGLSAAAVRNPATEASDPAGVFGVGDGSSAVGVRGKSIGPNAGVVGISHSVGGVGAGPGVRALSDDGIWVKIA